MPDWKQPEDYAAERSAAQWAWEFLRRNPDYRREWQAFMQTWRALEALYGRAPNRDFCAWKQDPRAWVAAGDCPQGDCRIDQDKVLIECALGARWGFHKFPPDPADEDAVGGGRLNWRDPAGESGDGMESDGAAPEDDRYLHLRFDLALPLKPQLEQAKRHLQMTQRAREREGRLLRLTVASQAGLWRRMLRLLDAREAGATQEQIAAAFPETDTARELALADALVAGGYRELARLPPR